MFYVSKTKHAFNPCDTNTPDTFVTAGYNTKEEAAEQMAGIVVYDKMFSKEPSRYCVIEHEPKNSIADLLRPKQPFGI